MLEISICAWNTGLTSRRAESHFYAWGQCHDVDKNDFPEYLKGLQKYCRNTTRRETEEYINCLPGMNLNMRRK